MLDAQVSSKLMIGLIIKLTSITQVNNPTADEESDEELNRTSANVFHLLVSSYNMSTKKFNRKKTDF